MKISAVIITKNEAGNIADALESVAWADEIIVVDSGSTDGTRDIAAGFGAKVIEQEWLGFSAQKQFAVDAARNDWILSLDADERVTEALKNEVFAISEPAADGYRIPRSSVYMGRRIRHGGWYPDRQLRLFDRRRGRWNGALIHESFQMDPDATAADLQGDIMHYSVPDAAHHHRMIGERYAPLAARQMFDSGRRTTPLRTAAAGWLAFVRSYILKAGFLDGFPGFCIAYFAGHNAFLKHLMLWELQRREARK